MAQSQQRSEEARGSRPRLSEEEAVERDAEIEPGRQGGSGDTVTIACKMPTGLTLRLFNMVEDHESVIGGGSRAYKRAEATGEPVVLNGNALDIKKLKEGEFPDHQIIGKYGYALTPGVSREFWAEWVKQNHDSPALRNGLIFAANSEGRARDQAREKVGVRSGLEPIDPAHPEKHVPGIRPGTREERDER